MYSVHSLMNDVLDVDVKYCRYRRYLLILFAVAFTLLALQQNLETKNALTMYGAFKETKKFLQRKPKFQDPRPDNIV